MSDEAPPAPPDQPPQLVRLDAPASKMFLEPICRYGHGKLAKELDEWAVQGVDRYGSQTENKLLVLQPNGKSFSFNIWRCPVCRYLELFDSE